MRRHRRNSGEPGGKTGLARALLLLLLLVVPAVATSGCASAADGRPRTASRPASTAATTPERLPLQVAPAPTAVPAALLPARLIIPKMRLDAPILAVGADATGAMIAPRAPSSSDPIWSSVYWWDLGALPGQTGNAVIAGHVNRPDASPSTFTNLNLLVPGDHIEVVTAGGQALTFVVTSKETPLIQDHDPGDPAFIRVFGPSLTSNLNLITCWGEWIGNTFNRRLVIHSTLVSPSPFGAG